MQRGHAPCGELKEKIRGSSSGSETPCSGQAKFSEKRSGSVSPSTKSTPTRPSATADAVSTDCVRRCRRSGSDHEPVDDHLDRVLELLVEDDLVFEQVLLTVHLDPGEPIRAQLLEHVLELALAVADDGCVDRELGPFGQGQDLLDDLVDALPLDRPAAHRAVRPPDARIEKPEVVVDLGDRPDRRAWVSRCRLLVDRDRRREPLDRVHVGLLHHLQELPRVGGQRLHVAPLTLRVDRVERETRLAGAGEPGDADQLVPRQPDRDVFEVVLARTVDDQLLDRHPAFSLASERVFV